MKLVVMQPYLLPYIGYFQLIYSSDLFLIYDDVTYIKQGYINRNSILSPNGTIRFTVPVPGASSNKLISELEFSSDVANVLKTIEQSYSKAPCFETVFPLIKQILEYEDRAIASVCFHSYETIFSYLGIEKKIKKTSELDYDRTVSARNRLLSLCQKFDANNYINAPGGRSLYDKKDFAEKGVKLNFIDSLPIEYQQGGTEFIPNLSIIDVLMYCPQSEVQDLMRQYELN